MKRMLTIMMALPVLILAQAPTLYINEFMASNDAYWSDENGDFDDWVEIYNPGTDSVDIGGLWFTDDLTDPASHQIPDTASAITTIPPGGFLILWADKESEQGPLHMEEKLSGDGEQIGLFYISGTDTIVIDSLTFGAQIADTSSGRVADGGSDWASFPDPTAGVSNTWTPDALEGIVINEFLASNDSCCTDENGDYDDFIELYNAGSNSINIGGMYITDDLTDPASWQIPTSDASLTTLAPGGFLLLWADKESEQGVLHVEEKLGSGGEDIGLVTIFASDTSFVDSLTFGEQTTDISYGRYPDGSSTWSSLNPTPGAANAELSVINEGIIPSQFALHQNYPNPFNPSTTIRFDIAKQSFVSVNIWNLLGQKVNTLATEQMSPGSYELRFGGRDAHGQQLSSGVYMISVEAESWSSTRKMILMK
ncbi:MAG: lamin tail domain-containing protein [Candidatus Marinimicrobia bacterium]|nr:lamin tail domain-containing protein [Candidatus Neomarinimicrobiota bacterium]